MVSLTMTLGLGIFSILCLGVFVHVERRINKWAAGVAWAVTLAITGGNIGLTVPVIGA